MAGVMNASINYPINSTVGGGETGIRTLGTREGSTVFETAPFDHSGTSPQSWLHMSNRPVFRVHKPPMQAGISVGYFSASNSSPRSSSYRCHAFTDER